MADIPGLAWQNVFLILASYFLVLYIDRKTKSHSAGLLLSVLTSHHIVAYLYAFYLKLPKNEVDPAAFLEKAQLCINLDQCGYLGYHLYVNYLAKGIEYGGSLYFVYLMNVLFFVMSIYYFIGIAEKLDLTGNRKISLLLYGMWPSVIYFTTIHYRETFELYLLMAGIYFGLSASKEDSLFKYFLSMLLLLGMGVFHVKGLLFVSVIIFIILLLYKNTFTLASIARKSGLLMIMILAVYFVSVMYSKNLHISAESEISVLKNIKVTVDSKKHMDIQKKEIETAEKNNTKIYTVAVDSSMLEKFMQKVTGYREKLLNENDVRTAFYTRIRDEDFFKFGLSYSLVYLEYLFSPFISQVSSFHDLIAYVESLLRSILFLSTLILIFNLPQARILFVIYVAITALWAVGVVSYGAGIRHHIMTNWILILLGIPVISDIIKKRLMMKNDRAYLK